MIQKLQLSNTRIKENTTIMISSNINKQDYESPRTKLVSSQFQGILCESVLEPIEEGGGHDW